MRVGLENGDNGCRNICDDDVDVVDDGVTVDDRYDYPGGKPVCSVEDQLGQTRKQDEPHHCHLDDNGESYDRDEETYDDTMTMQMVKLMMTKIFEERFSHLIFHLCPSPPDQAEKFRILVLTVFWITGVPTHPK